MAFKLIQTLSQVQGDRPAVIPGSDPESVEDGIFLLQGLKLLACKCVQHGGDRHKLHL